MSIMTYIIIYYESCAYLYYFSDVSSQIFTLFAYYTNNYARVKYYYLMIKNVIVYLYYVLIIKQL